MIAKLGHVLFWVCICAGLVLSLPYVGGEIFFGNYGAALLAFIAYACTGFAAGYALRFALAGIKDPFHNTRQITRRFNNGR